MGLLRYSFYTQTTILHENYIILHSKLMFSVQSYTKTSLIKKTNDNGIGSSRCPIFRRPPKLYFTRVENRTILIMAVVPKLSINYNLPKTSSDDVFLHYTSCWMIYAFQLLFSARIVLSVSSSA